MTRQASGTLEAARRVLAYCVVCGITLRVVALVPDGSPKIAVQPAGTLPDAIREMLAQPRVRHTVVQHLERGAARFSQVSAELHSHAATAAGLAHLTLCTLSPDQREAFDERAGIREFEGRLPRSRAELLSLLDIATHASDVEAIATLTAA